MKKLPVIFAVLGVALCLTAPSQADPNARRRDMNEAYVRGNAYQVRVHSDSNGPFLIEMVFASKQFGTGDLYFVKVACAQVEWSFCQDLEDLFPGCTPVTTTDDDEEFIGVGATVATSECPVYVKDDGACLQVEAYYSDLTGFGRLQSDESLRVVDSALCTPVL